MSGVTWRGPLVEALIHEGAMRGLEKAGQAVLEASNAIVPYESGDLEGTGAVTPFPAERAVVVSYDTPYAVRQHEELEYNHPGGREAKYLEKSLHGATGTDGIVAAEVRKVTGG